MITRIVKMTFMPGRTNDFLDIFADAKDKISSFEGCRQLQLLNDTFNPDVFFTYSKWESDKYLERYRSSELFKTTWSKTKVLFAAPPEAWSLREAGCGIILP